MGSILAEQPETLESEIVTVKIVLPGKWAKHAYVAALTKETEWIEELISGMGEEQELEETEVIRLLAEDRFGTIRSHLGRAQNRMQKMSEMQYVTYVPINW